MAVKQRILVIDDESDIGELISATARTLGLQCEVTTDTTAFLGKLSSDTTLILLDLIMPQMDGIELLRLLGKRRCKAGIVLMSGVGKRTIESAEQFAQILGLAIVGHLQKPFQLPELETILQMRRQPEQATPVCNIHPVRVQKEEIQRAFEHNEFVVYYQPQIDASSGRVIGVEALARWRHPERGLLYPDSFISRMENLGFIDELGWIVANRAMLDVGQFTKSTSKPFALSLNVSINSLCNINFPDVLVSIAEKQGVSAENVTIEVTETGLIKELSKTLDTLTRLRMKRVKVSVDDFGTGYATMNQFKYIPATELKIDKSFIQEMTINDRYRIMVQKTIEMGHDLGMQIIAEGVETTQQLQLLRSYGCDSAQGYLFSRPVPAAEMVAWLKVYCAGLVHSDPQRSSP